MPLYTFIMDFKGGTYISQTNSSSVQNACLEWAEKLKESEIHGFGKSSKKTLIEQIKQEEVINIKDTTNFWCIIFSVRGHTMLINIVQTETTNNAQLTTNN